MIARRGLSRPVVHHQADGITFRGGGIQLWKSPTSIKADLTLIVAYPPDGYDWVREVIEDAPRSDG
jgi:hypothetical protein